MDLSSIIILLAAGCAAGFLAGFFGVQGGIILVPFLLVFLHMLGVSSLVSTHVAFGTSLFVVIFTSAHSVFQYHKSGHVIWRAVITAGMASIIGAGVGSVIAGELDGKTLQRIFSVVMIIAAARVLSEQRRSKGTLEPNFGAPALAGTGLLVGIVSALTGVGGGMLAIPIMYTVLHFSLQRSIGTSSAIISITACATTMGYMIKGWGNPILPGWTLGYVDYLHAFPIVVGAVPLASIGARLASKSSTAILRRIFAALLLVVAFKMFFL